MSLPAQCLRILWKLSFTSWYDSVSGVSFFLTNVPKIIIQCCGAGNGVDVLTVELKVDFSRYNKLEWRYSSELPLDTDGIEGGALNGASALNCAVRFLLEQQEIKQTQRNIFPMQPFIFEKFDTKDTLTLQIELTGVCEIKLEQIIFSNVASSNCIYRPPTFALLAIEARWFHIVVVLDLCWMLELSRVNSGAGKLKPLPLTEWLSAIYHSTLFTLQDPNKNAVYTTAIDAVGFGQFF